MKQCILFLLCIKMFVISSVSQNPQSTKRKLQALPEIDDIITISDHTLAVNSVQFSKENTLKMITTGNDQSILIYDLSDIQNPVLTHTINKHSDVINTAFLSNNELYIATASNDHTAIVTLISNRQSISIMVGHTDVVKSANFSPDDQSLVTAGGDSTVVIWSVATGQVVKSLLGHVGRVNYAEYSHDGSKIASSGNDFTVKIWDARTGAVLSTISNHSDRVFHVAFSLDDQQITSSSADNDIYIVNIGTLIIDFHLQGHQNGVTFARQSNDNDLIISSSVDGTSKLWDGASGIIQRTYIEHLSQVNFADFSYDRAYFATAGQDKLVKIYMIACPYGYYLDNTTKLCVACHPLCARCSDYQVCEVCATIQDSNRTTNVPNCECQENFYDPGIGGLYCLACQSPCIDCQTLTQCNSCVDGFFFDNQINNCSQCQFPCQTCSSQTECITCQYPDLQDDGENCACIDGYLVFEENCIVEEQPQVVIPVVEEASWLTTPILIIIIAGSVVLIGSIIGVIYYYKKYKQSKARVQELVQQDQQIASMRNFDSKKNQTMLEEPSTRSKQQLQLAGGTPQRSYNGVQIKLTEKVLQQSQKNKDLGDDGNLIQWEYVHKNKKYNQNNH